MQFCLGLIQKNDRPKGVNTAKYIVGFICTVATLAIYGLLPPLMQVIFNRVIKKETFVVVPKMQIFISIVATVVYITGLFVSGEFQDMKLEAESFTTRKVSYDIDMVCNRMTVFFFKWTGFDLSGAFLVL